MYKPSQEAQLQPQTLAADSVGAPPTAEQPMDRLNPLVGATSPPRLRLPVLTVVLLALLLVFFQLLPMDPLLYGMVISPFRSSQADEAHKKATAEDPVLGSVLPLPKYIPSASSGGSGTDADLVLVVHIGNCSECVVTVLEELANWSAEHPKIGIALIATSSEADIALFQSKHPLPLHMEADATGNLTKRYNAKWAPRAYLLRSDGTLVWLQQEYYLKLQQVDAFIQSLGGKK